MPTTTATELAQLGGVITVNSGNVGVGTSPGSKLHISDSNVQLRLTNGSSHTRHLAVVDADNSFRITRTGVADDVTIDLSGRVGIGTTSPSAQIHVNGIGSESRFYTNGDAVGGTLFLQNSGGGSGGQILFGTQQGVTSGIRGLTVNGTGPAGDLIFQTRSTSGNVLERMTITSIGNVGIGTTSPNAGVKLHVETAAGHPGYFVQSGASQTGLAGIVIQKQDNNNTTSQIYASFNFNAGNSGGGGIQGNGATSVQFFSSSDIRLKENISGLESQLEKIALLKPSRFDLIEGQKNCVGLIAQEVEEIYPDAVGEGANGYKTIGGISIMETRLIKAIQELKAKNDILEAKVTALEAA